MKPDAKGGKGTSLPQSAAAKRKHDEVEEEKLVGTLHSFAVLFAHTCRQHAVGGSSSSAPAATRATAALLVRTAGTLLRHLSVHLPHSRRKGEGLPASQREGYLCLLALADHVAGAVWASGSSGTACDPFEEGSRLGLWQDVTPSTALAMAEESVGFAISILESGLELRLLPGDVVFAIGLVEKLAVCPSPGSASGGRSGGASSSASARGLPRSFQDWLARDIPPLEDRHFGIDGPMQQQLRAAVEHRVPTVGGSGG
ncbi:unnamed protein product, partial [Discosporangium mesarthrocarpum]